MVEQNSVTGEQTVGLSVIDSVPVSSDLGCRVGRSGMKRRRLRLWRRSCSEHLRRSGLVVLDAPATVGGVRSDGLQEAESTSGDDIGRVVGDLEGDSNVRLSS